jgi:hypothetical protein
MELENSVNINEQKELNQYLTSYLSSIDAKPSSEQQSNQIISRQPF